jgi:soluble lytic murein transglycosylase-like protein
MKVMTLDQQAALRSALGRTSDQNRSSGDNAFLEILKVVSEGQSGKNSENSALPPDADKLRTMIQLLQLQMNHRLINSVMTMAQGQDDAGSGLLMSSALSLPPELFKKPELPSKNQLEATQTTPVTTSAVKKVPWRAASGLDSIIERASKTYQVDAGLIKAVIRTESNFNPDAVSPKGARGLMQLMPATARDLGVRNPHDPEENVMAGTRYLKGLLDRYDGNVNLALAAYNWGMGNVERSPGRLPRETVNYVARINQNYQG